MNQYKKWLVVLITTAFLGLCVQGCSTFKGAGKDVQSVGRGMERASDSVTE